MRCHMKNKKTKENSIRSQRQSAIRSTRSKERDSSELNTHSTLSETGEFDSCLSQVYLRVIKCNGLE